MNRFAFVLFALAGVSLAFAGDGRFEIDQTMVPYTVTNPGSYVVTGNLKGGSGQNGIVVSANNVTLDLNGFVLEGSATAYGVVIAGNAYNLKIRNGIIRNWGEGVDVRSCSNNVIEDLQVSHCVFHGMRAGDGSIVRNCDTYANGGIGIQVGEASTVDRCIVRENSSAGIVGTNGCNFTFCVVKQCGSDGIRAGNGCTVIGCTVRGNSGDGIVAGYGSQISSCAGYQNDNGIRISGAAGNVVNCTAYGNNQFGVSVSDGGMVQQCSLAANSLGGLYGTTNCFITGNNAYNNGTTTNSSGFLIVGRGNRIEANHASQQRIGFNIQGGTNVIVRNTASFNTNEYQVVNGNLLGATNNPPASAGPWDNFDF